MRKALLALCGAGALAAAATTISTTPAKAWGGCGPYRHPTPWGCRWNAGPRYYGGPAYVVGPRWGYGYGYGWRRPYYRPYYHRYW